MDGLMQMRGERRERIGKEGGIGHKGPKGRGHGREGGGNEEKTMRSRRKRKGKMGRRKKK